MKYHRAALTGILLAALFLLAYQIHLPYLKTLEHGTLELRARNFLQEGFSPLRFLPVRNLYGGKPNFYLNHPPLFINFLALFLTTLGDSEVSARISVILFSLGSLWLLYLVVARETSRKLALWTVLIATILPIFFYYGRIVNYEPSTLFFSLLATWLFLRTPPGSNRYLRAAFLGAVVLGILSGWAFYSTPAALLIYALLRRRKVLLALGAVAAAAAAFLLMLWYYSLAADKWGGPLTVFGGTGQFFSLAPGRTILWTTRPFYGVLWRRVVRCFTLPLPFLAGGGLALTLITLRRAESRKILPPALLFLVSGSGLLIVAPKDVLHHDWGLFMLIPAGAFLSARLILRFKPLIRAAVIILLAVPAASRFREFHGHLDYSSYRAGKMIRTESRPGDTLLTSRGQPVAYYSGLSSQFFWPGPPATRIIRQFQPDWVVFREDQEIYLQTGFETFSDCLKEEGYRLVDQENYRIWKKAD